MLAYVGQEANHAVNGLKIQDSFINANVAYLYGQYLRHQGRWRESVQAYTKALTVDARLMEAYYGRASAYEDLKELARAEADAVRAIRQNPRDRAAHLLLLRIYAREGQKAKADAEDRIVQEILRQEQAQQALGMQDASQSNTHRWNAEKVVVLVRGRCAQLRP
jgi:tetratricopeptide (TPR) repeat protein